MTAAEANRTRVDSGHAETSRFNRATAAAIWKALQPLRKTSSQLDATLTARQSHGVQWVKPQGVAQINYRATTSDGLLRHASFPAMREYIVAKNVTRPGK